MIHKENEPTVKILVGYHKPAYLLKSDVLVPIHLGRSLAKETSKDGSLSEADYRWMLENMIGDDTGDNISKENRKYCEMTAIYWAWKNYEKLGNPDYIGFMHYRRHFIFNDSFHIKCREYLNQIQTVPYMDKKYEEGLGYSNISKKLSKDVYLPEYVEKTKQGAFFLSNLIYYSNYANPSFLEKMVEIVCKNKIYEKYMPYVDSLLNGTRSICFNSFIVKKKIFFEYCEFLFGLCHKLDEIFVDFIAENPEQKRQLAWVSEYITSLFFEELIHRNPSFEFIPLAFVNDTTKEAKIKYKTNYLKYSILARVMFGKKKKHYQKKYERIKRYYD